MMKMRATLWLLAAAAAFTVVSAFLGWQEEKARRRAGLSQRVFPFAAAAVRRVAIFRGDSLLARLYRDEGDDFWRVALPMEGANDLADAQAVREIYAFVELSSTARRSAPPPPNAMPLSVSVATADEEAEVKVFFAPDGGPARVQRDGEPETYYELAEDLAKVFRREPNAFRSLDLFSNLEGEIDVIAVRWPETGREAVLRREGGGWFLTHPVRWPAEPAAVERFLLLCRMLRAEAVVQASGGDLAAYGMDAPAAEVRISSRGREQAISFGRETAQGTYARRKDSEALYRVGRGLYDEIMRNDNDAPWHDRYRLRILDLLADREPTLIRLRQGDETLVLQRADGREWRASGARNFAVEEQAVAFLIQSLRHVQIAAFASERAEEAAAYGLDAPAFHIACEDAGGGAMLAIALSHPERSHGRLFAAVADRPQIFDLDLAANHGLLMPFIFYRSRLLSEFDHHRVHTVAIEMAGARRVFRYLGRGHWQLLEPQTLLLEEDGAAFSILVAKLSRLRCAAFYTEKTREFSKFGLDPCRCRVVVTFRSSGEGSGGMAEAWELQIGSQVEETLSADSLSPRGTLRFARMANEESVFLVDGRLVAELERDYR